MTKGQFLALSREEQKSHIIAVADNCIHAAPPSLAWKIKIYLEGK